jgi:hypothetical protein
LQLLLELADAAGVEDKVKALFSGQHINATEDRAVLHPALRAPRDAVFEDGGKNVVPEVWEVLDKIKAFSGGWVGGLLTLAFVRTQCTGPWDACRSVGACSSALCTLCAESASNACDSRWHTTTMLPSACLTAQTSPPPGLGMASCPSMPPHKIKQCAGSCTDLITTERLQLCAAAPCVERVRSGEWVGETGKPLTNVVAVGIGGSALGPLFVHTALSMQPEAMGQVSSHGKGARRTRGDPGGGRCSGAAAIYTGA